MVALRGLLDAELAARLVWAAGLVGTGEFHLHLHGLLVKSLKVGRDSAPLFIFSAWHHAESSQIVSWKQRPFLRQWHGARPILYAV